jgi:hypothetical protein
MATEVTKRTYPNNYYAWYNDDNRIAVVVADTTAVSGERTTEKYDTFQGSGSSGVITAFSNYGTIVTGTVLATSVEHGLLTGDSITIADSTNFDATETITRVDDDSFYFTATWESTADETGNWSSDNLINGLRITYHSKYEEVTSITNDLTTNAGLDSTLHMSVVCYLKSRMFEDMGDFQKAQYFRQMYEKMVKKHRSRRSGVRNLSVPRI